MTDRGGPWRRRRTRAALGGGEVDGYHVLSFDFILGEVVRAGSRDAGDAFVAENLLRRPG